MNPLRALAQCGQSAWYDYIRRDLLTSGELGRMIREDDLRGMTTNPSIFAAAVAKGDLYDRDIEAAGRSATPLDAYERLAVADVKSAADEFAVVFEQSDGLDGYVSIEVSPRLARDTAGTLAEARKLWAAVARPNVLIKIPGTAEGLPAIAACIAEGIPVNVTLLFSVSRYRSVMRAYLEGLERRAEAGLPLRPVSSVASFFVSRVDTLLDPRIAAWNAAHPANTPLPQGQAAIANAKLAYQAFCEELRDSPRFAALSAKGARLQRPLWASTSTKNPAYSPTLYVDTLVGEHTVNTLPPETFVATRQSGHIRANAIVEDLAAAQALASNLEGAGLSLEASATELEVDGVAKFEAAFEQLLATVASRQASIWAQR
jgi:transaldolase